MEQAVKERLEELADKIERCGTAAWAHQLRQIVAGATSGTVVAREPTAEEMEALKAAMHADAPKMVIVSGSAVLPPLTAEVHVSTGGPLLVRQGQLLTAPRKVVGGEVLDALRDKFPAELQGLQVNAGLFDVEVQGIGRVLLREDWIEQHKPEIGGMLLVFSEGSFGYRAPTLPRKVTSAMIEAKIARVTYEVRPDGRTTVCEITMQNGTTERGESSCALASEFRRDLGERYAYEDAIQRIWPKEGYLLREDHYRAGSPLV